LFQSDESKWPDLQRCQFDAVRAHADLVDAWIPDVRPLSLCVHDVSDVTEHLYSAPLWIKDWEQLSEMPDSERMLVSFREQRLSKSKFPWMDLHHLEREEDLENMYNVQ
jgi:hypothetical protein